MGIVGEMVADLQEQNRILREALEPFANIELRRDKYPQAKEDVPSNYKLRGYIHTEDIRRARKALGEPVIE